MDFDTVEALRERHAAWQLLRATNAALVLSFLGEFFVEANRGACAASELAESLGDHLYAINGQDDDVRFPKEPRQYLDDWSKHDAGYLRRFYPTSDDEVHYEVTPAFERAYRWVVALQERSFVGTESRLHIAVELLRQIVFGTEVDPQARLAELHRQRAAIDAEIAAVEQGQLTVLDAAGVRDRFQQFSVTARELLSDFREVEENFRRLDRAARERIAGWDGSKGELVEELIGDRSAIATSDQGRSFQAFYEFLLSQSRQEELTELLAQVALLDSLEVDRRTRTVHHDWSEAAERAQRTVRQISEQLRRFLDDQVWVENRRVLDLVRVIESAAIEVRGNPPSLGLDVAQIGIDIALPFERPLYQRPPSAEVESEIENATGEVDTEALFEQTFIDRARLVDNVRSVLPPESAALLSDIVALRPIEQGASEVVAYLTMDDDEIVVEFGDEQAQLEYDDMNDPDVTNVASLPQVTVRRR